jgi:hypothetical protein
MRFLLPIILLASALVSVRAELDLRPKRTNVGNGLIQRAYFTDGNKQFSVTIDGLTELDESEGGALFRFTNLSQATMRLQKSPFAKPLPFDDASLPLYAKAASEMLPKNSQELVLIRQTPNVLPVNRWKSYRFEYRHQIGGVTFCESITFLNFDPNVQIVIRTGCRDKDFPAVSSRADDIIRRWDEVQPNDEQGLN